MWDTGLFYTGRLVRITKKIYDNHIAQYSLSVQFTAGAWLLSRIPRGELDAAQRENAKPSFIQHNRSVGIKR